MQRPTRTRCSSPSSSPSSYKPAPTRPLTNILLSSLLLLSLLISTINATPLIPQPASPVLDAPLFKRSQEAQSGIHIPPGGIAGMVIAITVVVIVSVVVCCPCWRWIPRAGNRGKSPNRSGGGPAEPEAARATELGGREVVEIGPSAGDEVEGSQRVEKESPPGYDEVVAGTANTAGRSELDGKRAV